MTFDRRMKRLLPVVGLLAAAAALGACGNGLSPEESGTFQLTQVDGSSPPQVVATQRDTTGATDTTRTLTVVDGSVSVSSDGSATLSISGREVTEADGSQDSNTNNDAVSGSVRGRVGARRGQYRCRAALLRHHEHQRG